MANMKRVIEGHLDDKPKVKCMEVYLIDRNMAKRPKKKYQLKSNHTKEEFDLFMESLNVEYRSEWGGYSVSGIIWYEDGSWTQGKDSSFGGLYLCYHRVPTIPKKLM